jgi:hypothetical protein
MGNYAKRAAVPLRPAARVVRRAAGAADAACSPGDARLSGRRRRWRSRRCGFTPSKWTHHFGALAGSAWRSSHQVPGAGRADDAQRADVAAAFGLVAGVVESYVLATP